MHLLGLFAGRAFRIGQGQQLAHRAPRDRHTPAYAPADSRGRPITLLRCYSLPAD